MAIKELESKHDFDELVKTDRLLVLDAYTDWCGPCKVLTPKLEELSKKYGDVVFAKFNIENLEDLASELRIRAMPTLQFFKDGENIGSVLGFDPQGIERFIIDKTSS